MSELYVAIIMVTVGTTIGNLLFLALLLWLT